MVLKQSLAVVALFFHLGVGAYASVPFQLGTDGGVNQIVPAGDKYIVYGQFSNVGKFGGSGLIVDAATGQKPIGGQWPTVDGSVTSVIADPSNPGGFFIAGNFNNIGEVKRTGVARILPDGSVDLNWSVPLNSGGFVSSLSSNGKALFMSGYFSVVNTQRQNLISVDLVTGVLLPWNPLTDGSLTNGLAVSGDTVYLFGEFGMIDGERRAGLAAVDATKGELMPWNPLTEPGSIDGAITCFAVSGNTVFMGGNFTTVSGLHRPLLAAIDATSGAVTPWQASLVAPPMVGQIMSLSISNGILYVGGSFTMVGALPRNNVAAFDVVTGEVAPWDIRIDDNSYGVTSVVATGDTVYVAGAFHSLQGQTNDGLVAVDAATGRLKDLQPDIGNGVSTMAASGKSIYIAGSGLLINPVHRNLLAQVDANGAVTDWDPEPDNQVGSMVVVGDTVYMAGYFSTLSGVSRVGLGAVDRLTGKATAWNPNPQIESNSIFGTNIVIQTRGNTAYLAGNFTSIAGVPRAGIAAIDLTTGGVTTWNPNAGNKPADYCSSILLSGDTLYVIGSANNLGFGSAYSVSSGAQLPWQVSMDVAASTLAISGGTIFLGGSFTVVNTVACAGLAAVDAETGELSTTWNPNLSGGFGPTMASALFVDGQNLYVGGNFSQISGQNLTSLAAVDTISGAALPGIPGTELGGSVQGLLLNKGSLFISGSFNEVGNKACMNVAALPTPTP
jgi:trimeric autotransporter adhesin